LPITAVPTTQPQCIVGHFRSVAVSRPSSAAVAGRDSRCSPSRCWPGDPLFRTGGESCAFVA
jgi:hypothetical protein